MADLTSFVKIYRSIIDWRWYKNGNTFRVFMHCLINACFKDQAFEKADVPRGSFVSTYIKISIELGDLTARQVRTAIDHLKSSGELSVKIYPKFLVISVVNYNKYQGDVSFKMSILSQSSDSQLSVECQHIKNDNNDNKDNNDNIKKNAKKKDGSSKTRYGNFDVEEVFEKALKRTYGDL